MHVFTYGSLMFPEVWSTVVLGRTRHEAATAPGYARFVVRGETYPGAIAAPGASLQGVLYHDVDAADLERLDRFEGADYRRITVEVRGAAGQPLRAAMYLYLPVARLAPDIWDPEGFDLPAFQARWCKDCAR